MAKKLHAKARVAKKVVAPKVFQFVRKRDGRVVPFDQTRITEAILKALHASGEGNGRDAKKISNRVLKVLLKKYSPTYVLGIEEIQDSAENALILLDYAKTAKAYILYRKERERLREARKEVPVAVKQLVTASKKYFKNPLAEFVYYRTYSRWIDEEGRRETWIETAQRYMDFMKENLGDKLSEKEYKEVHEAILNQQAMPSMRLLQFAGKAARKTNVAAYNCSFIAPTRFEDFAEIVYISMCGTGVGFSVEHQNVEKLPQIERQSSEKFPDYVIDDSKEGWADALLFGMKTWFAGKDVVFDYSHLRAAGVRLKTMGGRSSGPAPLRELLDFTRRKILAKQGRRLSTLDVHDIICKIGEIVVSGGVRRSALISLSDLDDPEMRDAKKGQFYLTEPQRSLANNSAVYNEKPTAAQFLDEWVSLAKSGTGERGIFNRGGLSTMLPKRRIKALKGYLGNLGTNPCVVADTWVMTQDGARQVKDLIHRPFVALVNGRPYASSGFFPTGVKPVFDVQTSRGFSLRATGNHKILTVQYRSRKVQREAWKEVSELAVGDEIVLQRHVGMEWGGNGTEGEGWLLGNLLGDGNIEKNGKANLDYWGITQPAMMQHAVALVHETVGGRSDLRGHVAMTGYGRVGSMNLGHLATSYGMTYGHKAISVAIEHASSAFCKGFLRGWFDADGSVQGTQYKGVSVRLTSISRENLSAAQRMLARFGVISSIYGNRRVAQSRLLPDGHGGKKRYACAAYHELVVSGENVARFSDVISFSDPEKREKLALALSAYRRRLNREYFSTRVIAVTSNGTESVYDCTVPDVHAFDANGIYVHNCGEIVLQSREFCNLSEVVARPEDTEATLLEKVRVATILGTYQSTLTNFGYLSKEWKENCEQERLLGVSVTGQWDSPAARKPEVLRKMRDYAIRVNEEYAKRFGITPSTCITCVKPSGNLSQTVDASSGMHTRYAKYYIRRVRISATDSLFKMLKDQKLPYHPEVGQVSDTANTYVLEFPVKAPEGAATRNDVTALSQLEYWKLVKTNFTEHNPSVTVYVSDDEWIAVANWLYNNWEYIGGLSFLPKDNHVYELAPYEEITEERYKELVAKFPDIDFSQIFVYEKKDETENAKELACVAGVCEIT